MWLGQEIALLKAKAAEADKLKLRVEELNQLKNNFNDELNNLANKFSREIDQKLNKINTRLLGLSQNVGRIKSNLNLMKHTNNLNF